MLVASITAFLTVFIVKRLILKFSWLSVSSIVVVVFLYSIEGVEKYSDSFNEDVFFKIVKEVREGRSHTKDSIRALLGEPICKSRSGSLWSYSYMPSCGFGWTKRMVEFDNEGFVVRCICFSEP